MLCSVMNVSTLVSSVQRILFQKSYGLFRCNFLPEVFFLQRRGFLLAVLSNKQTSYLTFDILTEVYKGSDGVLGLEVAEMSAP